ncbi:MAG: NfeD family protein [Gaiellaceae bacterium]
MTLLIAILLAIFVLDEPWSWIAVGVAGMVEVAETVFLIRWSKRRRTTVGTEALVGRIALVSAECRPEGQVRVVGEIWRARCETGASVGEEVVVRRVDGLLLLVEPPS